MRPAGWIDRDDREDASIKASVVLPDGRTARAVITNVSAEGCQIDCEEVLPIGKEVRLQVGARSIAAHVRWAVGGQAGLRRNRSDTELS